VNLVLTGSVLVSNGQVRVNADLVRVADHAIVWSDTVSHADGAATAAHDAISLSIVNRLRLKVGQGQRRYQGDADVELMFLKAQGLLARRNTDNAGLAADLFERVIAREPEYAPAWAGLASAIGAFSMATRGEKQPPPDPRMEAAVREANRIDPLLAEGQSALGSLRARDKQWRSAEKAFRAALKLNPSLTTTYTEFVLWVLQPMGRQDEALGVLEDARAADPSSLDVRRVMALVQVDSGLYEDAIVSARWVLERDPDFPFAKLWLARALALSGLALSLPDRVNEAQTIFESDPKGFGYLGWLYARTGHRAEAEDLAAAHSELPRGQMLIYGGLGDKDRAFEALERLAGMNSWRAAEWMHRPEMALLRGDPRLDALKTRLGLPR
jgi:tetratricopeptide (TPR) repeat protein